MKRWSSMGTVLIAALALTSLAGCVSTTMFVYKPSAPVTNGAKLPVKIAVLPFADATEDYTQRGSVFHPETLSYNLAKTGIKGSINALTPEYWAKTFAEEIAASDDFQAVRFVYTKSELSGEEYRIEGTVEKATIKGGDLPNEFAFRIRAVRPVDHVTVWEKSVSRHWKSTDTELVAECGPRNIECWVDRHRRDLNKAMREIFTEARTDLVRVLAPIIGAPAGNASLPSDVTPAQLPSSESVDETIEGIHKGK